MSHHLFNLFLLKERVFNHLIGACATIQAKNGDVFFITVQIFEKNLVLWLTGLGYANIP